MKDVKQYRGHERLIGILFFIATLSYGVGNQMIAEGMERSNLIATMNVGIGLELINSIAVAAIGWVSFVVLRELNQSVGKGYMISRLIEGFLLAIGAVSVLLITESNSEMILKVRDLSFSLAMLSLGGYSIRYCWYLLQEELAPRWMMAVGLAGYISLCIYSIIVVVLGTASMWLFLPGGIFEVIFPIFLIAKGFDRRERTNG